MSSASDEDSNDESINKSQLLTVADRLLEVAEHGTISTNGLLDPGGGGGGGGLVEGPKFRSIEERLLQLHIEESAKAGGVVTGTTGSSSSCTRRCTPSSRRPLLLEQTDEGRAILDALPPCAASSILRFHPAGTT